MHYNTSIAAMMEYLNTVRSGGRTPARSEGEPLVVMVALFCPHIAEELWARAEPNVARHLNGQTIRRGIYVPDRLLNLIVG